MIHEAVIITRNPDRSLHIVPLGYQQEGDITILAPFCPSTTLQNLRERGEAVLNLTDNVAVIAGCLTGHRDWPTVPALQTDVERLRDVLAHRELVVERIEEDPERPRFHCVTRYAETHAPFRGFNRAQAACVEAAILVSRLGRLPPEKIAAEVAYLQIAIDKTAGPQERQAWDWLMQAIAAHRGRANGEAL